MSAPSPVDYQNGRPVYDQATPGITGAIKDAVSAIAGAAAPRGITQLRQREQSQEDAANGRMKQAQSTDRDNSYQY